MYYGIRGEYRQRSGSPDEIMNFVQVMKANTGTDKLQIEYTRELGNFPEVKFNIEPLTETEARAVLLLIPDHIGVFYRTAIKVVSVKYYASLTAPPKVAWPKEVEDPIALRDAGLRELHNQSDPPFMAWMTEEERKKAEERFREERE